jgi:hypothetical protein
MAAARFAWLNTATHEARTLLRTEFSVIGVETCEFALRLLTFFESVSEKESCPTLAKWLCQAIPFRHRFRG